MTLPARRFAGNPFAGAVRPSNESVGSHRELERDLREAGGFLAQVAREASAAVLVIRSDGLDAGSTYSGEPFAACARIGVRHPGDHARQARFGHEVGTSSTALSARRARLERDVERSPACRSARLFQRHGFRVGTTARPGPAAADDDAILDYDCPYCGVGPAQRPGAFGQAGRRGQPACVLSATHPWAAGGPERPEPRARR